MNFIYILQSDKNKKYYVSSTNNLERRLKEYNSGKTKSLRYLTPLKLVFKKRFNTAEEAKKAEFRLKKAKSRRIINQIIADQEIKMGL